MQVSAINSVNSFSNVNFEGKKHKKNKEALKHVEPQQSGRFMSKLAAPAAAAMFLVPVVTQSCQPDIIEAHANAAAIVYYHPGQGCGGCGKDTVVVNQKDTLYFPTNDLIIPQDIQDSLNIWRGDFLDVPVDGDEDNNGSHENQVLLNLNGLRDWDYKFPESIRLNLLKTNKKQAVYDHVAVRSNMGSGSSFIDTELKVTKVNAGDVTVVKADGTESNKLGGLLFEEDGKKLFAHSNGRDSIYLYKFVEDGINAGKYESVGQLGRGYLGKAQYGENFLLDSVLGEGTEDHMIQIGGKAMTYAALKNLYDEVMSQQ